MRLFWGYVEVRWHGSFAKRVAKVAREESKIAAIKVVREHYIAHKPKSVYTSLIGAKHYVDTLLGEETVNSRKLFERWKHGRHAAV